MEVYTTSFIRNGSKVYITKESESAIKTITFKDCFINSFDLQPLETVINPGIIITQCGTFIKGSFPNGPQIFKYKCIHRLKNFQYCRGELHALDAIGKLYIMGKAEQTVFNLNINPIGYRRIPKTPMVVYWTLTSLGIYDIEKRNYKLLTAHHSKIVACDTSMGIMVTADSVGIVCIWYVSSWECHHAINTDTGRVLKVIISDIYLYILFSNRFDEYNIQTGIQLRSVPIVANDVIQIRDGFLVSNGNYTVFIHNMRPLGCIKHSHRQLIKSNDDNHFFALCNKKLVECHWLNPIWAEEFLRWIEYPTLPFDEKWPIQTSLEALALTADLWVPRATQVVFPKHWFRNEDLRNNIWDAVIENDIEILDEWDFLTDHVMNQWYLKNIKKIKELIDTGEYKHKTAKMLTNIYKKIEIDDFDIQKWVYKWSSKPALRPIIIHFLSNAIDSKLFNHIAKAPCSPDDAIFLNKKCVSNGIKKKFVAVFIRMLLKYHKAYPGVPTHHMMDAFKQIVEYIYCHLNFNTMCTPLKESGEWELLKRPNPSQLGAYIRHRSLPGHITKIEFGSDHQIHWKPVNSCVDLVLSPDETIYIWKYYHTYGPNTLLECALTILSKEHWCKKDNIIPFKWPLTEAGAREFRNISVRVFDEPMRIKELKIEDENKRLHTSTGMTIHEIEQVDISVVTPLWSYYDTQTYHTIPIKLKVCSEIVKTKGLNPKVSIMYAKELMECMQYKNIEKEHRTRLKYKTTAIGKIFSYFFIGTEEGHIIQYDSAAHFKPSRHFIKHTHPIISMRGSELRLMSMCKEEMNIWSLSTGNLLFVKETNMEYIDSASASYEQIWSIEREQEYIHMTLWDIHTETPLKTDSMISEEDIFTTDTPAIISGDTCIYLTGEQKQYTLNIDRDHITCVTRTYYGIAGGTHRGLMFYIDDHQNEILKWQTDDRTEIRSVVAMDDQPYIISGTHFGEIIIWKIEGDHKNAICLSKISAGSIDHLFFDNMFLVVISRNYRYLLTVIHERCALVAHALYKIIQWNSQWKQRLHRETKSIIQPTIENCILHETGVDDAMNLLKCATENYEDRLPYCSQKFIDMLVDVPRKLNSIVIKRLASFRGPKLDCAICGDIETESKICYLKTCQHRFHSKCIKEMIRKVPEYHHEMQQEYALHYNLMCPVCREPFTENDVAEDIFLNQHFSYS